MPRGVRERFHHTFFCFLFCFPRGGFPFLLRRVCFRAVYIIYLLGRVRFLSCLWNQKTAGSGFELQSQRQQRRRKSSSVGVHEYAAVYISYLYIVNSHFLCYTFVCCWPLSALTSLVRHFHRSKICIQLYTCKLCVYAYIYKHVCILYMCVIMYCVYNVYIDVCLHIIYGIMMVADKICFFSIWFCWSR